MEAGLIDQVTLDRALELQRSRPDRLGRILIDMGVADEEVIAKTIADQLNLRRIPLDRTEIDPALIAMIPAEMARHHNLVPAERDERGNLLVAMEDPLDFSALEDVRFATGKFATAAVATPQEISRALARYYAVADDLDGVLERIKRPEEEIEILDLSPHLQEDERDLRELLATSEQPPVVRLSNAILIDAIQRRASDIHIEPHRSEVLIRYRIDGVLQEMMRVDRSLHAAVVSRLKVISKMDLAVRRRPQDGKSQVRLEGKFYDLRVSTIPTSLGETMTIRILDPVWGSVQLEDLGFAASDLSRFSRAIEQTRGIVLVTGPTGSGKTSTLYACLNRLRTPGVNVVTVEDPVEYDVEGVNQVQINPKSGMTFASGLRSILRQDPDIVLVGEIRDAETVSVACQAAQTGHLVLSTLHTIDAPSSIARLRDLGAEPYLLSDALVAVLAQRLVRRVCPECQSSDPLSPELRDRVSSLIGPHFEGLYRGRGCQACHHTGYQGRLGLFEVLIITPELQEVISQSGSVSTLKKIAFQQGYRPLLADGLAKALKRLTTIQEVFRVAPSDSFDHPLNPADLQQEPPEGRKTSPAHRQPRRPGPGRILVVDDSETIRRMISGILEKSGYRVTLAQNGEAGLQAAVDHLPDLIVTDFLMPRLNGYEMIRKLKARPDTREIPVIMLTAKDDVESEIKVIDAGAHDYLAKPVDAKRLLARVRRMLRED